jgi:UDP-glucose 4-epimerase
METVLSHYCYDLLNGTKACKVKGVIHFVACRSVEESLNNLLLYYINSVCRWVNFLILLKVFGIKNFVYSSSATIYGSRASKGEPLIEEYFAHETQKYTDLDGLKKDAKIRGIRPKFPYSQSTQMCEGISSRFSKIRSNLVRSIVALRYFNHVDCHKSGILGEDARQQSANLVPIAIRVLTGIREKLKIMGTNLNTLDGTTSRDYIHVRTHRCSSSGSKRGDPWAV